jgi:hypothetical protein
MIQFADLEITLGRVERSSSWSDWKFKSNPSKYIDYATFQRWKSSEYCRTVSVPSNSGWFKNKRNSADFRCSDEVWMMPAFNYGDDTNYILFYDIEYIGSDQITPYLPGPCVAFLMGRYDNNQIDDVGGFNVNVGYENYVSPDSVGLGLMEFATTGAVPEIGYKMSCSAAPASSPYINRYVDYTINETPVVNWTGTPVNKIQYRNSASLQAKKVSQWLPPSGVEPIITNDPSSTEGGEEGTFDPYGDDIAFPDLPSVSGVSSGLIKIYKPTIYELQNFAQWLYASPLDQSIWTTLTKLYSSPFDYIISLQLLPINTSAIDASTIKLGPVDTNIQSTKLTSQYYSTPEYTKTIDEYYGSFIDYTPNTKIMLYLPFIGFNEITADDAMAGALSIKYNIDLLTGDCIAFVRIRSKYTNSVMYQYKGNCAAQIPLTGRDFSQMISAGLAAATNIGFTVATGGGAVELASAAGKAGARSMINSVLSVAGTKPTVNRGGAIVGNASHLTGYTPYLLFMRPAASHPKSYEKYKGRPSNITASLSSLRGYTEIDSIITSGFSTASSSEIEEIKSLLSSGVYL